MLASILLCSCGGGGSHSAPTEASPTPQTWASAPLVSDVLAKIYDPSYTAPSDFFVDARAATHASYSMHHVLDETRSYERCTDDFTTALAWEEHDNASRSVRGQFVEAIETDRYFEVARELAYGDSVGNVNDMTSPGFARVYKCSNTARDGVNRSALQGFAGNINARPLTNERVREFSQYLWQFAFFPTARKKVLDTYSTASTASLEHRLVLGFATSGGANACDQIEVVEWSSSADRQSGEVTQTWQVIDTFSARLESAGPVLCED